MEPNPFEVSHLPPHQPDVPFEETSELATRLQRLVAKGIDVGLHICIFLPAMVYSGHWNRLLRNQLEYGEGVLWYAIDIVVYLAINGYTLAKRGQSIGKLVVEIRIVDANTNQLIPLSKLMLFRDYLIRILVGLPLIGGMIGFADILLIFTTNRRCMHDYLANTKVIVAYPKAKPDREGAGESK